MSVSAAEVQTIAESEAETSGSVSSSETDTTATADAASASGDAAVSDAAAVNTEQNLAEIVFSVSPAEEVALSPVSDTNATSTQTTNSATEVSAPAPVATNETSNVTPDTAPVTAPVTTESTAVTTDTAVSDPISSVNNDAIVITESTESFPVEPIPEEFLDQALEESMRDEIDEDLSDETGRDPDAWLYTEDFGEMTEGFDTRYVRAGMSGNELKLYRFLTERLGLNTAAACGVLANVYCESGFSTSAIGDHGTSIGICQWHNGRKKAALSYLDDNGYERTSLAGQMFYMREELNGGYRAVYDYLLGVSDTADGAYQAARYFCLYYEIPANRQNASKSRGNLAKKTFWAAYAEGREEVTILVKQTKAKSDAVSTSNAIKTADKTSDKSKTREKVEIDPTDNDAVEEGSIPNGIWILGLQDSYAYSGDPVKPDIRVYDGVKLLTKNEDYKVAYQHYDEVGTAKIRITTTGDKPQEIIREYKIAYTEETAPKILPGGFSRLDQAD